MTDEVLDKCLKELQATESFSERMVIQDKYGISDICERCKNAMKYEKINMCLLVEWCKWDLDYKYFRKERQVQNSRDCKNFLDDGCIEYMNSCPKDNHDNCMGCKHFEIKEKSK